MTVLAHLDAMERALTAASFPAMSPWWRAQVVRFYESGRRQCVLRVGRRGGKSSTLCRIAVLEALFGEHMVPPGDVAVCAFISVSRDEANQRLRTVKAILDALRISYRPIEHGIELEGRPVAFKVFVATIAGVSGPTVICAICDEVSKWRDIDSGVNPASEVLASLRPTLATQANAKMFLSSSPLGPDDAHATAFNEGENDFQCVAYAPTWEANPAVTEAETHALEPDPRRWAREYLAEPQAGALAAFDAAQIDRAMSIEVPRDWGQGERVMLVDPTAGSSDTYAFAVAAWRRAPGGEQSLLEISDVDGVAQAAKAGFTSDSMTRAIAAVARRRDVSVIHSDQFERFALASAFATRGFSYVPHTWTAPLKERAVEQVRMWLRDGLLVLPKHDRLRHELLAFEERIAPSGALTFRGRQGGHDDFAMLILLAALVDIEGGLADSPSGRRMSGAGVFSYYERMFAGNQAAPSLPIAVDEPDIELAVPARFAAGSSTFSDAKGRIYPVENGRIRAQPRDVAGLQALGFTLQ